MAFTFGFYNSLNGDRRYNAEQFGEIFDGILRDGIIPSIGQLFAVTTANNGMQINVGTGRAWFNHTWNKNDSIMVLTVPLSDVTRSRYDAVVLEVNANDEIRTNSIKIVQGEPLVNPVKPVLVNTAKVHQYPLAYIKVEPGAEVIKASMIESMIGREPTVFATGVLETVPIDALWEQWRGEWNDWFDDIKLQLSGNVATNLQYQIDQLKSGALTDSRKATSSEAISGTNNTKWMTPSTTSAAIDANLGIVKDTYGNKANITVRNPAIITWSKMGAFYSTIDYGYGANSKRLDLNDYFVTFTLVNTTDSHSATSSKGYFYSANYNTSASFTAYVTVVRKSDLTQLYHRSLGSCTKTAGTYGIFICDKIDGASNKILYSIGQYMYVSTVTASGLSTNVTVTSSFAWQTSSRARSPHVIVATNQNYVFAGVYYTYEQYEGYDQSASAYMCNLNTYATSSNWTWIDSVDAYVLTNSGILYLYTVGINSIISAIELNLNGWAYASFNINIKTYSSSFSSAGTKSCDAFYDRVYDRIVFGVQGSASNTVSSSANVWFSIFNGRNVISQTTYNNTPIAVSFAFTAYDVSSHTALWQTYVMTYTTSSVTIRALTSDSYGTFQRILSGYGYLTSSGVLIRTDLSTINLIDRHIANDINATIIGSSESPVGLIGSVSIDSGYAYVIFKVTNTIYIRD